MWKHVIVSSIQAAFAGATLLTLLSLPSYGGAATIFGITAFPIAALWCLILAYPLLMLRQALQLREYAWLAIYSSIGFVFGAATPILIFGLAGPEFSVQSVAFFGLYGLLGTTCAITAWNYVRRHVSL